MRISEEHRLTNADGNGNGNAVHRKGPIGGVLVNEFEHLQLRGDFMSEPLQFVPVALIPEIRLRPTEREAIRIVATLEWIASQWIAVWSQYVRPLRLVGIEGTHHEEPALVI